MGRINRVSLCWYSNLKLLVEKGKKNIFWKKYLGEIKNSYSVVVVVVNFFLLEYLLY